MRLHRSPQRESAIAVLEPVRKPVGSSERLGRLARLWPFWDGLLVIVTVCCVSVVAAPATSGEFQPDVHTLFLAHFNDDAQRADYALGVSGFCGNGARRVAGYFGSALDLQPRGLHPDFMNTCQDYTPRFDGWGFRARGNVDPAQGTFECWFQVADPKRKSTWVGGTFLNADLQRCVPHPEHPDKSYASFSIALSTYNLRYSLPTVAGHCFLGEVVFKKVPGFARALQPGDWHHFALTWSQGEMVLWLDGRAVASFDMTGQLGLVLLDNPTRYLSMGNCLLDELRISNVVRYGAPFEPAWRDGQRPDCAFSGVPDIKRYKPKLMPAPVAQLYPLPALADETCGDSSPIQLSFDRRTGTLLQLNLARSTSAEGLHLYVGLDRRRMKIAKVLDYRHQRPGSDGTAVRFTQQFEGNVEAVHEIARLSNGYRWQVTLVNRGEQEVWLEALLGVPFDEKVSHVFDGCEIRSAVALPRHRDEYCLTLPFVAAASGPICSLGVGIDPRVDLSDIVTEWVPTEKSGVIRVGTKLALAPRESFTLPFLVVDDLSESPHFFGTLDAIAAFHDCFPDLYKRRPDVPVYSYMPATQDASSDNAWDMKRLGYAGGIWGHGPGHDKGDEFGRAEWWDNPELYSRPEYQGYTRKIERLWGTLAGLREIIPYYYRQSYDNGYPVRRFHTCPDLTPEYIVNSLWPGHQPNEDPLCFGQYYKPITNWFIVNECRTPIGAFFCQTTRDYFRATAGYCPGYINDMSHAGALYRHNDPIAQKTPGRSFSRDLGPFVRKALGRKQRYEVLNQFVDDGHRASMWSDGGAFSYTLCAYSAAIAIEGGAMYKDLTGSATYVIPARNLLGEKPLTAMTHINDDWTGRFLSPEEFTPQNAPQNHHGQAAKPGTTELPTGSGTGPKSVTQNDHSHLERPNETGLPTGLGAGPKKLRDYYRYCDSQLTLFCLRYGVTLDPSSYMWGRQVSIERAPLMVESTVLGRKIVPAARVSEPLWVVRAGEGLSTLLVIGNTKPAAQVTELKIINAYFQGAPIVAPYYGGEARHDVTEATTTLSDIQVPTRDVAAFKAVALLQSSQPAKVISRLEGDGLTLHVALDIETPAEANIRLSDFGPLYEITELKRNGRPVTWLPGEPLAIPAGKTRIEYTCLNRELAFTAAAWNTVDLIQNGTTNFCLVADPGTDYTVPRGSTTRTFQIGYERGTAAMLNQFIEQYDAEDGVPGNLRPAPFVPQRPEGFTGWVVRLAETPGLEAGRVRIDPEAKEIVIEGRTQGEIRRAMVVFMRLVDRKYPHVGRFFPLAKGGARYESGKPLPLAKWVERQYTREFFEKFPDPLFLVKPILAAEYEPLYEADNMDFAGRYSLRASPYIFEPTYGDDFVYGYSGPAKATPRAELHRELRPQ